MKSFADILRQSREKIADPKHWTKGNFAQDEEGEPVSTTSPRAVCWCAIGAIDATAGGLAALYWLSDAVHEKAGPSCSVSEFNDKSEHADVLAAFDRAIELAEAAR